jgi:predicted nuclease of predicted toxin-antitoxin system
MRILLDESVPAGLKSILTGHDVTTVPDMGWAAISNGKLLDAAELAGFQILLTADSNIRAQQRMTGRKIAMVVLTTNHWITISGNVAVIQAACGRAVDGSHEVVELPKPPIRRRPPRLFRHDISPLASLLFPRYPFWKVPIAAHVEASFPKLAPDRMALL